MKTPEEQKALTPEAESCMIGLVYGPPVSQEQMRAAMEKAALQTQSMAEQAFMVYGPPNMIPPQNPSAIFQMQGLVPAYTADETPVHWEGDHWICRCGTQNSGKFCTECGAAAPEKPDIWNCECGAENTGKFCMECGRPKQMKSAVTVRAYTESDLPEMLAIWNAVVAAGDAFPQEEPLDAVSGAAFFAQQSYTGVAEKDGAVCGLYILHPNNVGRCGHICNASYAVSEACRGQHIGEQLVLDCIGQAKAHGFRILQFNAVVESNTHAQHLYERLGFTQLGTIAGGFRMPDGSYANICPYYREV